MNFLGNEIFAGVFLALALVLTFLMYYLWKFPYDKTRNLSEAPRRLVNSVRPCSPSVDGSPDCRTSSKPIAWPTRAAT